MPDCRQVEQGLINMDYTHKSFTVVQRGKFVISHEDCRGQAYYCRADRKKGLQILGMNPRDLFVPHGSVLGKPQFSITTK